MEGVGEQSLRKSILVPILSPQTLKTSVFIHLSDTHYQISDIVSLGCSWQPRFTRPRQRHVTAESTEVQKHRHWRGLHGWSELYQKTENLEELIIWSWLWDTTSQIGLESTGTINILSSQPFGWLCADSVLAGKKEGVQTGSQEEDNGSAFKNTRLSYTSL